MTETNKILIRNMKFSEGNAWITLYSKDDEYLGTWHTTNKRFIEYLKGFIGKNAELKIEASK